MRPTLNAALVALSVSAGVLGACVAPAPPPPPRGAAVVGPSVAFSYSDGYWDRNKQWHAWRDRQEYDRYRQQNPQHHVDRRHDQENGWGWHDNDRYWERR